MEGSARISPSESQQKKGPQSDELIAEDGTGERSTITQVVSAQHRDLQERHENERVQTPDGDEDDEHAQHRRPPKGSSYNTIKCGSTPQFQHYPPELLDRYATALGMLLTATTTTTTPTTTASHHHQHTGSSASPFSSSPSQSTNAPNFPFNRETREPAEEGHSLEITLGRNECWKGGFKIFCFSNDGKYWLQLPSESVLVTRGSVEYMAQYNMYGPNRVKKRINMCEWNIALGDHSAAKVLEPATMLEIAFADVSGHYYAQKVRTCTAGTACPNIHCTATTGEDVCKSLLSINEVHYSDTPGPYLRGHPNTVVRVNKPNSGQGQTTEVDSGEIYVTQGLLSFMQSATVPTLTEGTPSTAVHNPTLTTDDDPSSPSPLTGGESSAREETESEDEGQQPRRPHMQLPQQSSFTISGGNGNENSMNKIDEDSNTQSPKQQRQQQITRQHCAHYLKNGMCCLGPRCKFIHVVDAAKHKIVPKPAESKKRKKKKSEKHQQQQEQQKQHHNVATAGPAIGIQHRSSRAFGGGRGSVGSSTTTEGTSTGSLLYGLGDTDDPATSSASLYSFQQPSLQTTSGADDRTPVIHVNVGWNTTAYVQQQQHLILQTEFGAGSSFSSSSQEDLGERLHRAPGPLPNPNVRRPVPQRFHCSTSSDDGSSSTSSQGRAQGSTVSGGSSSHGYRRPHHHYHQQQQRRQQEQQQQQTPQQQSQFQLPMLHHQQHRQQNHHRQHFTYHVPLQPQSHVLFQTDASPLSVDQLIADPSGHQQQPYHQHQHQHQHSQTAGAHYQPMTQVLYSAIPSSLSPPTAPAQQLLQQQQQQHGPQQQHPVYIAPAPNAQPQQHLQHPAPVLVYAHDQHQRQHQHQHHQQQQQHQEGGYVLIPAEQFHHHQQQGEAHVPAQFSSQNVVYYPIYTPPQQPQQQPTAAHYLPPGNVVYISQQQQQQHQHQQQQHTLVQPHTNDPRLSAAQPYN